MNSNTFHDFENIKPQFVIIQDPKICVCIKIGMYTLYLSIGVPLNLTL